MRFKEALETPQRLNDAASLVVVLCLLTLIVSVGTLIAVGVRNAR